MPSDTEIIKRHQENQEQLGDLEKTQVTDIGRRSQEKEVRVPTEVTNWMDKLERNVTPTTYADPNGGQLILKPSAPTDPKVVLPITRDVFLQGFSFDTSNVQRWLSEFIFRFIKLKQGGVTFKQDG